MPTISKTSFWVLALMLVLFLPPVSAQEKDTMESRMRKDAYRLFEGNDSAAFTKAIRQLGDYYRNRGNWFAFYNTWENEIIYDINHDYYYEALRNINLMHSHMLDEGHNEELYRKDFLLGAFYGTRDNNAMCEKHLKEAIRLIRKSGRVHAVANIYTMLANLYLFNRPDSASAYIDQAIAYSDNNRLLSANLQLKGIIEFVKQNRTGFDRIYARNEGIRKSDPDNYNPIYEEYLTICRRALDGQYDEAIRLCEQIEERETDKYLFLVTIYDMKGDKDAEIRALRQLMDAKEKRYNYISTMEINEISHDMRLESMRHKTRMAYSLTVLLAFVAAMIIVFSLIIYNLSKRRHIRLLKKQNRELSRARLHAQETDRMKAAFIRNVSHQIRTPLNAVSGFSYILAKQGNDLKDTERNDLIERIEHNTKLIANSFNYLLSLSGAESVRVCDQQEPVNCNALCSSIASNFKPTNQLLAFTYTTDMGDEVNVKTDQEALTKVIMELLTNADKFTEQGSIRLHSEQKYGEWHISVSDTGKGIPEGYEERIFGQFAKIDDLTEGLGIGLTFCKNIALQLGGNIWLDRSYAEGSRFVVSLPIR